MGADKETNLIMMFVESAGHINPRTSVNAVLELDKKFLRFMADDVINLMPEHKEQAYKMYCEARKKALQKIFNFFKKSVDFCQPRML